MRRARASGLVGLGLIISPGCGPTVPEAEPAFSIPQPDLIPEGIAYDSISEAFFVGSTNRRKIVRIGSDGTIEDFVGSAEDGLWGVLGLAVDAPRRILWAASSDAGAGMPIQDMDPADEGRAGIFKYDLDSGTLMAKYLLGGEGGGHFLNDLAVTPEGTVYTTDSGGRGIYRIHPDTEALELFLAPSDLPSPNGITWAAPAEVLFVALDGQIGRIEPNSGEMSYVNLPEGVSAYADGLYYFDQSLIAVWPFEEGPGVTRYWLDPSLRRVTDVEPILPDHPSFLQPTTGAVVDDAIYVIANSQLQLFRGIHAGEVSGGYEQLVDPVVLRVALAVKDAIADQGR